MPLSHHSKPLYFVFDCESVGIHGETFAVGWIVIDEAGNQLASAGYACPANLARGDDEGRAWLAQHLPDLNYNCLGPKHVREEFCRAWQFARNKGVTLVADCPWPVEARFLTTCVDEGLLSAEEGPYPLLDVASVRLAAGFDPLAEAPRLLAETPLHDPRVDAKQSARLLIEAINLTRARA